MALGVHQQAFLPGQIHFHRAVGMVDRQGSQMLHRHILLAAKAAANQGVLHLDLVGSQHQPALVEGLVGALVGGVEEDVAVFVQECRARLRLQKCVLRPGSLKVVGNHEGGLGYGSGGIPPVDVLMGLDVGGLLVEDQILPFLCLGDGMHRLQHLILHLDKLLRLLHSGPVLRHHQGNGVAQVMGQTAHRDHGVLVVLQMADLILAGDILRRQNRHHTGQSLCLGGVDGQHSGSGVLGPQGGAVGGVLRVIVVGIFPPALNLLRNIQPVNPLAHLPVLLLSRDDSLGLQPGSDLHRLNDLHISGAAAVIVPQGVLDFRFRRVGVFVQQRLGAHHHTGDAEAALNRARLTVGICIELALLRGEALHGDDLLSRQAVGGGDAGFIGFPIDDDGTGAAGPLAAPILHGGEVQIVPKESQQTLFLGCLIVPSIDMKGVDCFTHSIRSFRNGQAAFLGEGDCPLSRSGYFSRYA